MYAYDLVAYDGVYGTSGSDEDKKTSDYLFIDVATDEAGNPVLEAEYAGYDDNGTPEDESDDNHLYYIRRYKLREALVPLDNDGDMWENEDPVNGIDDDGDGAVDEDPEDYQPLRNASEGHIGLYYEPDLQKVAEWSIPSLLCVEHDTNDGLRTSTEGEQHSLLIKVPVALMDKAGGFRFVISAKDSHADREKGHRQKWALERNQRNLIPSTAQLALDETVSGEGSINDVPWAQQAYKWLSLIWNPSKRKFENGYRGWPPLGQPERGGSGVIVNTWAHMAIHTLNRLHDPARERRGWAHRNAIWGFYGHANPMVLEMPAGGYITNWANDDPTRMAYTIRNMDLSWMRLAYLAGCGTAGGCIKGRDENGTPYHCCDSCSQHPCPAAESIAQTFYDQGADAVVGFRGLLYEGDVFGKFNDWFWYLLCRKGLTVGDAVKEAKKKLPWWTRLYSDERDSVRGAKVWGGGTVIYPPGYGQ